MQQGFDLVGRFPGEVLVALAKVTVVGGLGVNRAAQVELLKAAKLAHDVPSASAGVRAILAKAIPLPLIVLAMALVGCTPTELQILSAVEKDAPIACDIVAAADPGWSTIVCAIVNAVDGALTPLTPVDVKSDVAAQFVGKRPSLSVLRAQFAARKAAGR